jgi:hypothetical protein
VRARPHAVCLAAATSNPSRCARWVAIVDNGVQARRHIPGAAVGEEAHRLGEQPLETLLPPARAPRGPPARAAGPAIPRRATPRRAPRVARRAGHRGHDALADHRRHVGLGHPDQTTADRPGRIECWLLNAAHMKAVPVMGGSAPSVAFSRPPGGYGRTDADANSRARAFCCLEVTSRGPQGRCR